MYKALLIMALSSLLMFQTVSAEKLTSDGVIEAVYPFKGDSKGEFVGDLVFRLNDGSEWKTHKKDAKTTKRWSQSDFIEVSIRTSFYFFKREHKFILTNHTRKETARAMIINYQYNPVFVKHVELLEVDRKLMDKYETHDGQVVKVKEWVVYYHQFLHLSNGEIWRNKSPDYSFKEGAFVYVVYSYSSDGFETAVVRGTGRNSYWTKVTKA